VVQIYIMGRMNIVAFVLASVLAPNLIFQIT
jgi:hypothetical protein